MTKHLINGKPYSHYETKKKTELQNIVKGMGVKLEKIIVITSKPFEVAASKLDPATDSYYSDTETTTGKLVFIGHKDKLDACLEWLKEVGQYDKIDELYIFDRYHISGEDMIESYYEKMHEYNLEITIKDKFKECWWNGNPKGCQLFKEYALDPNNERW